MYRTECYYDLDSDHRRKGALKRDIHSLQQQNEALAVIVSSLRRLPETEALSLLQSLRSDVSLDILADSLKTRANPPQNIDQPMSQVSLAEQFPSTATGSRVGVPLPASREDSGDSSQQYSGAGTPLEASERWFKIPYGADYVVLRTPLHEEQPPSPLFFSDPALQADPSQPESAPWEPFPSQTLPMPPQSMVPSMSMDSTQRVPPGTHGDQWMLPRRSGRDQLAQPSGSQHHSTFWPPYDAQEGT